MSRISILEKQIQDLEEDLSNKESIARDYIIDGLEVPSPLASSIKGMTSYLKSLEESLELEREAEEFRRKAIQDNDTEFKEGKVNTAKPVEETPVDSEIVIQKTQTEELRLKEEEKNTEESFLSIKLDEIGKKLKESMDSVKPVIEDVMSIMEKYANLEGKKLTDSDYSIMYVLLKIDNIIEYDTNHYPKQDRVRVGVKYDKNVETILESLPRMKRFIKELDDDKFELKHSYTSKYDFIVHKKTLDMINDTRYIVEQYEKKEYVTEEELKGKQR